jgi:hypothetical protein
MPPLVFEEIIDIEPGGLPSPAGLIVHPAEIFDCVVRIGVKASRFPDARDSNRHV